MLKAEDLVSMAKLAPFTNVYIESGEGIRPAHSCELFIVDTDDSGMEGRLLISLKNKPADHDDVRWE